MDKKLPRIFRNDIDKKINNNRVVYYASENNEEDFFFSTKERERKEDAINIDDKINQIFKPGHHSFNVGVKIITKEKTYDTKIAGKVRDCLITLDNDVIRISDILDIIVK